MYKKSLVLLISLLLVGVSTTVFAEVSEPTKAEKFEHADKNDDGAVDNKEIHMEKKWEQKKAAENRSFVNSPAEKRYDIDGNGWLDSKETKALLKDKYAIIQTDGKAKVNTAIETKYDANKDGVIDAAEAEAMQNDM